MLQFLDPALPLISSISDWLSGSNAGTQSSPSRTSTMNSHSRILVSRSSFSILDFASRRTSSTDRVFAAIQSTSLNVLIRFSWIFQCQNASTTPSDALKHIHTIERTVFFTIHHLPANRPTAPTPAHQAELHEPPEMHLNHSRGLVESSGDHNVDEGDEDDDMNRMISASIGATT